MTDRQPGETFPAVLGLLLEAGADLSARDQNGWSALRWARQSSARRHSQDTTSLIALLEGAGARDSAGSRAAALFDAVLHKDLVRVREALRSGADANARDDRGVPPLIYAGNLGQAEIVKTLVDGGADVNANPEHDTTPLISAIVGGSVEAVRTLLAAGARIDQSDTSIGPPCRRPAAGNGSRLPACCSALRRGWIWSQAVTAR